MWLIAQMKAYNMLMKNWALICGLGRLCKNGDVYYLLILYLNTGVPDMSNTIEGDIDIDFLGVLTLTIDIELVTFE